VDLATAELCHSHAFQRLEVFSVLDPPKADHFADSLTGSQHEYKIALGAALFVCGIFIHCRDSRFQVVVCWGGFVVGNVGVSYS